MVSFTFLINSNIKNKKIVLPKLINSFILNKIPPEKILIVFGGCDHIFFKKETHYSILGVTHNSIDFTALIAVIEHVYSLIDNDFLLPDYWFYLHDTCMLGTNFFAYLNNFLETMDYNFQYNTLPLTYYKSMNIGLYKYTFLLNHKNRILKLRSSNYPPLDQIQHLKKIGVYYEDFIFYLDNNKCDFNEKNFKLSFTNTSNEDRVVLRPQIIYENSNILRITEYFKSLDFYKYKANWELKEHYTLDP